MDKLIKSKQESFDAICYVIKALGLFFCFYPLFNVFFQYSPQETIYALDMRSLITAVMILALVLGIWLVLQPTHTLKTWRKWLEICVFYGICVASILASGGNSSNYKFLFVFLVVTYTVQYGMRYGLAIGISATVTLLGMDLIMTQDGQVSQYFQSDLALSIMFIIISYILGRYVGLENDHIEELTRLANYDGLTNLYNHRYFHENMENQWKHAEKQHQSIALLMMDIDYFKMFNDICGHLEGDRVLTLIAGILHAHARPRDIACRYGGEEFVMILPDTTQEEALERAEIIRQAVMSTKFDGEEYLPNHCLTISLGVAVNEAEDKGYNEIVTRADNALYRAKYLRKNRVELYQNFFDRFENMDSETKDALLSIRGLVSIVNVRDDYTYSHTERVAFCCEVVARHIGLSEEDYKTLLISAYMHDVGKINIPKEVLISSHRLNDEEWELVKRHPIAGQTILSQISGMETVGTIVSNHHERYDGSGYPKGLSGEEIHPLASLLTLADSFDAMTNDRPYQKKRSYREALDEIERCSGRQFHPKYAQLFVEAIRKELDNGGMTFLEEARISNHKIYHGL
ncbi:MAG: diguanylate cyclase [Clostridiales bacterium]|nr:diguanylate cyclase [Clostridiales bacterium]